MARSIPKILELEHSVLRALCNDRLTPAVWDAVAQELANHEWRAQEHQVVYEALGRIRHDNPKTVRDELPAQTTRMGFPEVDWTGYFESGRKGEQDLAELVRELGMVREERP
jgi:hypothetical protein